MKQSLTILTSIFLVVSILLFWHQAICQSGPPSGPEEAGKKVFVPRETAADVYGLPPLPPFFEDDKLFEIPPQPMQQQQAPSTADEGVDWSAPWLDPRVKQCVREYLDKRLVLLNQEQHRNNKPPFTRIDDWGRVLRPPSLTADRAPDRTPDSDWINPTHYVWMHFNKPDSPLGGVEKYVKECVGRGGGGPPPPTGDAIPPPPARDGRCCEEYASLAVCQQNVNMERGCGFTDPPARWHLNYQVHYNWCLGVAAGLADSERRAREDVLRNCISRQCDEYANTAVMQQGENERRQCGYTGARWHFDYQRHDDWCLGVSRDLADSETRAREDLLRDCNGGQPPPPDGKCECVNFAFIGMTSKDNDRVGIHDDGYDADGKPDGQFALTIRCTDKQMINKLHIKGSLSRYGKENLPQFDTKHGNKTWLLGVYKDGVRLDRKIQPFSHTVVGEVNYTLYAGDPNIPAGQPYTIDVFFDGRPDNPLTCGPTVVSKPPVKTTSTSADTDKDDFPFDKQYGEFGNLLADSGADHDTAYTEQVYADSAAEGVKGPSSSERLSRRLERSRHRPLEEIDDTSGRGRDVEEDEHPADTEPPQTVTGVWKFHMRCKGKKRDVAALKITLNESEGGAFSGGGDGKDYNGQGMKVQLRGTYNSKSHLFKGQIVTTFERITCVRKDTFSVYLKSSDTGYFPTKQIQKCGCDGTVRLRKIKTEPATPPSKPSKPPETTTFKCKANQDCWDHHKECNWYCRKKTGECVKCKKNQHGKRDGTEACCSGAKKYPNCKAPD